VRGGREEEKGEADLKRGPGEKKLQHKEKRTYFPRKTEWDCGLALGKKGGEKEPLKKEHGVSVEEKGKCSFIPWEPQGRHPKRGGCAPNKDCSKGAWLTKGKG